MNKLFNYSIIIIEYLTNFSPTVKFNIKLLIRRDFKQEGSKLKEVFSKGKRK